MERCGRVMLPTVATAPRTAQTMRVGRDVLPVSLVLPPGGILGGRPKSERNGLPSARVARGRVRGGPLEARKTKGRRGAGGPLWAKAPLALFRYPGAPRRRRGRRVAAVAGRRRLPTVPVPVPSELLRPEIANRRSGGSVRASSTVITNVRFSERVREGDDQLLTEALDDAFDLDRHPRAASRAADPVRAGHHRVRDAARRNAGQERARRRDGVLRHGGRGARARARATSRTEPSCRT